MIFLEILVYAFLGAVVKVATETLLITYTLVSYGGSNTFHYNMLISPLPRLHLQNSKEVLP